MHKSSHSISEMETVCQYEWLISQVCSFIKRLQSNSDLSNSTLRRMCRPFCVEYMDWRSKCVVGWDEIEHPDTRNGRLWCCKPIKFYKFRDMYLGSLFKRETKLTFSSRYSFYIYIYIKLTGDRSFQLHAMWKPVIPSFIPSFVFLYMSRFWLFPHQSNGHYVQFRGSKGIRGCSSSLFIIHNISQPNNIPHHSRPSSVPHHQ